MQGGGDPMLNQIFKVIYNHTLGKFIVVSELAKNKTKLSQTSTNQPQTKPANKLFQLSLLTFLIGGG